MVSLNLVVLQCFAALGGVPRMLVRVVPSAPKAFICPSTPPLPATLVTPVMSPSSASCRSTAARERTSHVGQCGPKTGSESVIGP